MKRLNDPNIEVQRAAVTALGDLKSKRAIDPLIGVLRDDNVDPASRRRGAREDPQRGGDRAADRGAGLASIDVRKAAAARCSVSVRRRCPS